MVHQRLSEGRLVEFIVAQTTETHNIDHDVFLEFLAILKGQFGHFVNHFRVVRVHVENRSPDGFGHFSAVESTASITLGGSKTDLVIGNNMQSATG